MKRSAIALCAALLLTLPALAQKVTVPAGTRVLVRMVDTIDSSKAKTGDLFTATLETNLQVDGKTVAPRGTKVIGKLAEAKSAGRFKGSSELKLELIDIVLNGNKYPLLTQTFDTKGKGEGKETSKKVIGGAGLGALIGGIAGGGSGAAIGLAAGAAGGTAMAATKKGQELVVPSEALIEFRLAQPAMLPARK